MFTNVNLLLPRPVYKACFSDKIPQLWCKWTPWGQEVFLLIKIYINFPKIYFWSCRSLIKRCKPQHTYIIIISCMWRENISWLSGKLCRWLLEGLRSEQLHSEIFHWEVWTFFLPFAVTYIHRGELAVAIGTQFRGPGSRENKMHGPGPGTRGTEGEWTSKVALS